MTIYEDNWLDPPKELTKQQKAAASRERKKHFKVLEEIRTKIIKRLYPEHADHKLIIIDTSYDNGVFAFESNLCECKEYIDITKKMFEDEYGTEYKLILST